MSKLRGNFLSRVPGGGLAGLLAAAVALGVAQLVAGLTGPQGTPVVAVGGVAITLTPESVKDFAIAHFGSHDKQVLVLGILVILAVFAALIGVLATHRAAYGVAGLAVFGGLGVAAAVTRPTANALDALPAVAGAVTGAVVLLLLTAAVPATGRRTGRRGATAPQPRDTGTPQPDRRRFLVLSAGAAALAAATAGAGELVQRRFSIAALRAAVRLPAPVTPAPSRRPGASWRCLGSPRSTRPPPPSTGSTPTSCSRRSRRISGSCGCMAW